VVLKDVCRCRDKSGTWLDPGTCLLQWCKDEGRAGERKVIDVIIFGKAKITFLKSLPSFTNKSEASKGVVLPCDLCSRK
jgi:hypothetical protein